MNAGAYDGEIKSIVHAITAVSLAGDMIHYSKAELQFGYRHSIFQDNQQMICEVEFALTEGLHTAINDKMGDLTTPRK